MAFPAEVVQSRLTRRSSAATSALTLAYSSDIRAGSLLVCIAANSTPASTPNGFGTVTDSLSNTWTNMGGATANNVSDAVGISMHWARAAAAGACTVSFTPAQSSKITMVIIEVSLVRLVLTPYRTSAYDAASGTGPHLDFGSAFGATCLAIAGITNGSSLDEAIGGDANCTQLQEEEDGSNYCPIHVQWDSDCSERIFDWTTESWPWASFGAVFYWFDGVAGATTGQGFALGGVMTLQKNLTRTLKGLAPGGH